MSTSSEFYAECAKFTDIEISEQIVEARARYIRLKAELIFRIGKKANQVESCPFVQSLEPQTITNVDDKAIQVRVLGWSHAVPGLTGWVLAVANNGRSCFFRTFLHNGDEFFSVMTYDMDDIAKDFEDAAAWCFETFEAVLAKS